jgi:endonuclease/exonuclease/phosphatase family metal-dependent hydrolase
MVPVDPSSRTPAPLDVRVVTYNVHRCQGLDRRTRPDRIAAVLRAINADVIALQEVIGPGMSGPGHVEEIGAALGMGWLMASTRERRRHQFGNVVLSRHPMREHAQHDLSWKTCEPRCSQRVTVDLSGGRSLDVFNVHLGTALLERRYQAERLASWVQSRKPGHPKIVLGDFNEWSRGLATEVLTFRLHSVHVGPFLGRRRSYPSFFPVLHLDHIYFEGPLEVRDVHLPRTRLSRVASDHLPLVADIRLRA